MFKLPESIDNKYRFVTLAAKRAEQLQAGALPRVQETERKHTVLAQQEVAAGLIELWSPSVDLPAELAAEEEEQE